MPVSEQAMATLRRAIRPVNDGDAYFARRQSEIVSGADDLLPGADSAGFKIAQAGVAKQHGVGVSRDALRQDAMAALKQKLGLAQMESDAQVRKAQTEGEYDIAAQREAAKAAADRLAYSQEQIGSRQEANQAAIMNRLDKSLGAQAERQQVGIDAKAGQVNPSALTAIARERAALEKAVAEAEPGVIGRFLRRPNPRASELEQFDNTLGWAQRIAREFPDASAEEALAAMGQSADPDELGRIQTFLLMLRGR